MLEFKEVIQNDMEQADIEWDYPNTRCGFYNDQLSNLAKTMAITKMIE